MINFLKKNYMFFIVLRSENANNNELFRWERSETLTLDN